MFCDGCHQWVWAVYINGKHDKLCERCVDMSLGNEQEEFSRCLGQLIVRIYANGYRIRMGDVWAREGHKKNSQHYKKLAADINLFKDGDYLTKTEDHKSFGEYWESLHTHNRWGGRYDDGNHYERIQGGWR